MGRHEYRARLNDLARQVRELASDAGKHPHAVADAVKGAVTLPYEGSAGQGDVEGERANDLPVFGWAWREDARDLRA